MSLTLSHFSGPDLSLRVMLSLKLFFDERIRLATPYGPQYQALWEAARQASDGGKKIRPALLIGTYQELGGDDTENAVQAATAFELLHTAFLLHDDVIDRDLIRRGRPNLIGAFASGAADRGVGSADAQLWGQASAILAGDLLIHSAQMMVASLAIPEARRAAMLDLLDRCVFVTAAGEHADVAFSSQVESPELPAVLAMTEHKTACYSFEGPLKAAAILADSGGFVLRTLGEFGRRVGIAFQLRDDLLGVFGDEAATGKSSTSDLREGKVTALLAYARLSIHQRELNELLARPQLTDADHAHLRSLVEQSGARSFVEKLIADHTEQALTLLESVDLPGNLRLRLRQVARDAAQRSV
ncbi:polyprenyl synthetase family protein [Saxibacter everestensis]|uniref:Polyprenyl synthetase family protein n=1 Tax=Saxibacter everestensis TaxID=2909229 RepID=A0ABY8QTJ5_9MICO|nr:polyprenyl synthetase family protein [Brevibacteriaceae bacterium ZFBP1038]